VLGSSDQQGAATTQRELIGTRCHAAMEQQAMQHQNVRRWRVAAQLLPRHCYILSFVRGWGTAQVCILQCCQQAAFQEDHKMLGHRLALRQSSANSAPSQAWRISVTELL